jgi:hypothetical protein
MKLTNLLSFWASRHPHQAIPLIIIIEITNILIGIMVGSALLKGGSSGVLMGMIVGLILLQVIIRRYAALRLVDINSRARFVFQKQTFFYLFCLNLFTYTIAGGILGRMTAHPEGTTALYSSLSSTSETVNSRTSGETKLSFREKMYQKMARRSTNSADGNAGHRVGYFLLFLLGVGLAFLGALLSCNIACSGYGVAAVLVFLLAIGVLAGGFYFFGRGIDQNMKPYKDMTRDERKREGRRYLRTLAGTVGAMGLLILIQALTNQ